RSISRMPGLRSRRKASLRTCAAALVASNTMSMSAKAGMRASPSTPSAVVPTPMRAARCRPSEAGSMPTMATTSRCWPWRSILIMRSVPMLPLPMMAALSLRVMCFSFGLSHHAAANAAQIADARVHDVAGRQGHHGPERARQDHLAGLQRLAALGHGAREPVRGAQGVAQAGGTGADGGRLAVDGHLHAEFAEIERAERHGLLPQHVQGRRGVVRHGV